MPDRLSWQCARSALTRVPPGELGVGWTTSPAGLQMTARWLSSNTTSSSMGSGRRSISTGSGISTSRVSPGLILTDGLPVVLPESVTLPLWISAEM